MSNNSAQPPTTTPVPGASSAFDRIAVTATAFLVVALLILPTLASDVRAVLSDMGNALPWFTRWAIHPVIPRLLAMAAVAPLLARYRRAWRRRAVVAALIVAVLAIALCVVGLLWPHFILIETFDGS
jgi:hypothetical protein